MCLYVFECVPRKTLRLVIQTDPDGNAGETSEEGKEKRREGNVGRREERGGREEGVRTCHVPRLIMGSMVKMWPGLTMPLACVR